MTQFARCFLLVFCQLGVGGLLALAVPPFLELERGFYKSSASVFFSSALVGGLGTTYLRLSRVNSGVGKIEVAAWVIFVVLFALYLSTLWGDAMVARARLYVAALLVGFSALAATTMALVIPAGGVGGMFVRLIGLLSSASSAVLLGSVMSGMLIGHWYLIDPGMEIGPFHRCFRYFVGTLWVELGVLAVLMSIVLLEEPAGSVRTGLHGVFGVVGLRLLLGPVAALAVAAMIRRVLAIPQTMAATGLFYIATLAVLVGELLGRFLLFRTGVPL